MDCGRTASIHLELDPTFGIRPPQLFVLEALRGILLARAAFCCAIQERKKQGTNQKWSPACVTFSPDLIVTERGLGEKLVRSD
jgi:hypothetical protein